MKNVQFAKVRKRWMKRIGKSWRFLHHYCFGIMRLNQSFRMTESSKGRKRKATLNWALKEFEYVENAREFREGSFPLSFQLFMYKSQIYLKLGRLGEAQRAIQQAAKHQKRRKSRQ